jgi:HD-like signal output (HDOD) protein
MFTSDRKAKSPRRGFTLTKARDQRTPVEVTELRSTLARRLQGIGIASRPEVALKLLDLQGRADAQLHDYSRIIKGDAALTGKLLKLTNAAVFAQRRPVTTLDRACLLLGLERLRAVALGFQLCKSASTTVPAATSRTLWGQSVFRACLAAESARLVAPAHVAEAFIIGLMLDAGLPLMNALAGNAFSDLDPVATAPARLHRAEMTTLEFTHVDVAAAIAAMWALPELLARPLELHHTPPSDPRRTETEHRLHRVAFAAGNIELSATGMDASDSGSTTVARALGLDDASFTSVLERAGKEFRTTIELFADVADNSVDVDAVIERARNEQARALDDLSIAQMRAEALREPATFSLSGRRIEVRAEGGGMLIAFLFDSGGRQLVSQRFEAGALTADPLCEALGLDAPSADDRLRLDAYLRDLAA